MNASSAEMRHRHLPGEPGIWVFIAGDIVIFTLFFATFLFYRGQAPAVFAASQRHLEPNIGAFNTVLMLSSSWCVASAVKAARAHSSRLSVVLFSSGFVCGLGFVCAKYIEWSREIRVGRVLTTDEFFGFYYMFTGIHLVHVLIGMAVLVGLARYASSGGFDERKLSHLESGASFWHLVDMLWIVLFPLLYLVT